MRTVSGLLVASLLLAGGCAARATPPGPAPAAPGQPPAALAETDAARMMGAFVAPAGAVRVDAAPAAYQRLNWAVSTPGSTNLAHETGWWKITGNPGAVLAAVESAPPGGSSGGGRASAGGPDGTSQSVTFVWPPAGLLDVRWLEVGTARLGSDTIIRTDAFVTYRDVRPASALIPAGVVAATASITYGQPLGGVSNDLRRVPPEPVVVTDPARLAKAVALIDAAPTVVPGPRGCPMSTGGAMRIDFRSADPGPTVAGVTIPTSGCAVMSVTAGGTTVALEGGPDLVNQLIDALGLPWPAVSA